MGDMQEALLASLEAYVDGRADLDALQVSLVDAAESGDDSDATLDVELMVAETVRGDRSEKDLRRALRSHHPADRGFVRSDPRGRK